MSLTDRCSWYNDRDKLTKKHYPFIGIQNKNVYLCIVKSRYLPRLLYKNIIEYLKVYIYGLCNWKRLYRMRHLYWRVPCRRHLWRWHLFYQSRSMHGVRNLCGGMSQRGYLTSGVMKRIIGRSNPVMRESWVWRRLSRSLDLIVQETVLRVKTVSFVWCSPHLSNRNSASTACNDLSPAKEQPPLTSLLSNTATTHQPCFQQCMIKQNGTPSSFKKGRYVAKRRFYKLPP